MLSASNFFKRTCTFETRSNLSAQGTFFFLKLPIYLCTYLFSREDKFKYLNALIAENSLLYLSEKKDIPNLSLTYIH